MGNKTYIKNPRLTVRNNIGLISEGDSDQDILEAYAFLVKEDIQEVLNYAA